MKASTKRRGKKLFKKWNKKSHEVSIKSTEHIKENLVEKLPNARNVRLLILEWSLLVLALIFLACAQAFWYQNSYSTKTFTNGGTYTEGTLGKINSLNPLFANTGSEEAISKLLFATLTTTDYTGHSGNGLAQSIMHNENAKVWTIRLRDNLKWSDGQPITNEDVLFTISLIQNPSVNTAYKANLSGVKVNTDDAGNIVFSLSTAYVNFDSALEIPILPKHSLQNTEPAKLAEAAFNNNPVTSGPFSYNASQSATTTTSNDRVVFMAANDFYYQGRPMLDTFAVHAYESLDDIKLALKEGAISATAELPSSMSSELVSNTIQEKQTTLNSGVYAFLNTTSIQLNNRAVRQAIRQGIDMNNLREILHGEAALDYPLLANQIEIQNWPALPGYNKSEAQNTLKTAGINTEIPLQIATVNNGYMPELARRLANQLQDLGFKTDVTVYEPDQNFISSVLRQRNYDILIYEIELGEAPDLFAYYHSSQASSAGLNLSNYRNTIVDSALLASRTSMNEQLRATRYESLLKTWVNDVPAIGIYQPNLSYYLNKNVRSFSEDTQLVDTLDRFNDVRFWASVQTDKHRTP